MAKRAALKPSSSQNETASTTQAKQVAQKKAKRNIKVDPAYSLMQGKYIQAEWDLKMFTKLLDKQHKWEENSVGCYLACKAALLASGAEGLRQSCFLGYGPFSVHHFPVDRPQERENGKENQRSHVQEHVAAIDAATEVLLVLHVGKDPQDGHYLLLQYCKTDNFVRLYQAREALQQFITSQKLDTFIGLVMAEITGETRAAKWDIKYKRITTSADLSDANQCGPVAICAVEHILSTEWGSNSTRALSLGIKEHPRRQAVCALKSVVQQCYENEWFDEESIAEAAAATKELCGEDLKILKRR